MELRQATEKDLERLVEIHLAAYPDPLSVAARQRNFTQNPFGKLRDLVVAVHKKSIVAHGFLFAFEAWFGGRKVPVGGIASVGVAVEARGKGIGRALLEDLHQRSKERGDVLTMLYAFRHRYYADTGYCLTSSRKRLWIDPRSIPWDGRGLRRPTGQRDRAKVEAIHLEVAQRSTGMIGRTRSFWDRLFAREDRFLLLAKNGYVAFVMHQDQAHARTTLEVEELCALDGESRRALLGGLKAMKDQVHEIILEVPEDDPLDHVLLDLDGHRDGTAIVEHSLGELVGGPMIRLHDERTAIEARGYLANANTRFGLNGLAVEIKSGRARVRGNIERGKDLRTNIAASLLYGGLSVDHALALGLAEGPTTAALSLPPMMAIDAF